jgi:hypothetical protein
MAIETNKIKEIYKGHYQVILDFPSPSDLTKIIDTSYKYVWCIEHNENSVEWEKYDYHLYGKNIKSDTVFARNIEMEYLMETSDFLQLIPEIHQTVKIMQTNIIPPYYLNLKQLSGKGKYDLLKNKIDYLFELEMPGAIDYTPIISSQVKFLEKVIEKFS